MPQKLRPGRLHAFLLRRAVERRLERPRARLPRIVIERPPETLHSDARHRHANPRIHRRRQIRLHPALGKPDQPDPRRIRPRQRLHVIDQPHHIPNRVVKERMLLARLEGPQHRRLIVRRPRALRAPFAVITPVDRDGDEPLARQPPQQRNLPLLITTRAVQHHNDRQFRAARRYRSEQQPRHPLRAIGGICEMKLRHTVRLAHGAHLRGQRHPRPVDHLQESGARRLRVAPSHRNTHRK